MHMWFTYPYTHTQLYVCDANYDLSVLHKGFLLSKISYSIVLLQCFALALLQ